MSNSIRVLCLTFGLTLSFIGKAYAGETEFDATIVKMWEVEGSSVIFLLKPSEDTSPSILASLSIEREVEQCETLQIEIMRDWSKAPWVEKEPLRTITLPILWLLEYAPRDWLFQYRENLGVLAENRAEIRLRLMKSDEINQMADCEFLIFASDATFSQIEHKILILDF